MLHSFCKLPLIAIGLSGAAASAATFGPAEIKPSSLAIQITAVTRVGVPENSNNYASPVASHGDLYVLDQRGTVYRDSGAGFSALTVAAPAELTPDGSTAIANVAAGSSADELYVLYTSSTLPTGVTAASLPQNVSGTDRNGSAIADLYDLTGAGPQYHVLYRYTTSPLGLTTPVAISAFETQARGGAHYGGGLVTLPDGRLLLATGDNLPWGLNGLDAPQNETSHVSKLLLIDPDTGTWEVAAKGVRNTQSLWLKEEAGETYVVFADIGGVTAEELNAIAVSELTDTSEIENFGWGIAADGKAREGTFTVESGLARSSNTPTAVAEVDLSDPAEQQFEQPYAQFNRENPGTFFGVSGVGFSDLSFDLIELLAGDLVSGALFATTAPLGEEIVDVFEVSVFDSLMQETSLLDLSIRSRTDPRFFNFADGTAGVLIESTGALYRLTEISAPAVPLPASGALLFAGFAALYGARRRVV